MRPRYADLLRRMLDPDPIVADAAFDAVLFDRQEAVPDLIECFNLSKDPHIRYLIVQLLGFAGSSRAVPTLLLALEDAAPAVRAEACRSLEDLACKAALEALQTRLGDADEEVRDAAAEAIEALKATG
jgi:HEAT repeat protein